MPFTISHIAAVIPLNRKGMLASALVIGSMIPDLAYFVYLEGFNRDLGHSIKGLFTFCLPVGLVLLSLFHKLGKRPLFALLPKPHQQRLLPYLQGFPLKSWKMMIRSLLSLAIGILSHLAWDSFTHNHGFFVRNVAALRQPILDIFGTKIHAFSILQHGSTVIGLVVLVLWCLVWYRKAPVYPHPIPRALQLSAGMRLVIFSVMAGGVCFLGLLTAFSYLPHFLNLHVIRRLAERLAVISMAVLSMEIILYCAIWHLFPSARRESER